MSYKEIYTQWCTDSYFDEATKAELKAIAGDEKEIEDRFYRTLEFGTAGLRGVIGLIALSGIVKKCAERNTKK